MGTFKKGTMANKQQPGSRFWLLASIVVAFALAWVIGTRAVPAASATVSGDQSAAPGLFQSPPGPFLSPVCLPLIAR